MKIETGTWSALRINLDGTTRIMVTGSVISALDSTPSLIHEGQRKTADFPECFRLEAEPAPDLTVQLPIHAVSCTISNRTGRTPIEIRHQGHTLASLVLDAEGG